VAAAPRVSPASRGRRKLCAASLNYARASHEVAKGNIKTAKQLADLMVKDVVPAGATFEAAFSEARVGKAYLARYYLRALEMKAKNEPQPELVPNEEEEDINLEHVLPGEPEQNWPEIDPELEAAYYNRIGNMVLLQAKKNSARRDRGALGIGAPRVGAARIEARAVHRPRVPERAGERWAHTRVRARANPRTAGT